MTGRSTNPWTRLFPGKFHRARRYARGMPKTVHTRVAQSAARRVRRMDDTTSWSDIVDFNISGSELRIILARGITTNMTSIRLRPENAMLKLFI
jgi:hypothetical protein